jgi:hypothetical protein
MLDIMEDDLVWGVMEHCNYLDANSVQAVLLGLRQYIIHKLRKSGNVEIPDLCRFKREGSKVSVSLQSGIKQYFKNYALLQPTSEQLV